MNKSFSVFIKFESKLFNEMHVELLYNPLNYDGISLKFNKVKIINGDKSKTSYFCALRFNFQMDLIPWIYEKHNIIPSDNPTENSLLFVNESLYKINRTFVKSNVKREDINYILKSNHLFNASEKFSGKFNHILPKILYGIPIFEIISDHKKVILTFPVNYCAYREDRYHQLICNKDSFQFVNNTYKYDAANWFNYYYINFYNSDDIKLFTLFILQPHYCYSNVIP